MPWLTGLQHSLRAGFLEPAAGQAGGKLWDPGKHMQTGLPAVESLRGRDENQPREGSCLKMEAQLIVQDCQD